MLEYTNPERGKQIANLLIEQFSTNGIFGHKQMPEDLIPQGVNKGSLEHRLFITLTVSIDYIRDADDLWKSARATYEDTDTRYLFSPKDLIEKPPEEVKRDLQKYELSKKPDKDALIWSTIAHTLFHKYDGNPLNFLKSANFDAINILARLNYDSHFSEEKQKYEPDFPYLKGPKIAPLWVRMLRDNVGINNILNLEKVPVPVDVHVARASLSLGIVFGNYEGSFYGVFDKIRKAWFEAIKDTEIISLDVDEPLWHLSKHGCSKNRSKETGECRKYDVCHVKSFCIRGKLEIIKSETLNLNTNLVISD